MNNRTNEATQELPIFYHRKAWADEKGHSWAGIGKRLGITGSRVCTIMKKGHCPQAHIDVLKNEFNMPEHLLPKPSREKPGPLPKAECSAVSPG